MSGGRQLLDQITMQLLDERSGQMHNVFIDVFDNSLSRKWLDSLNHLLVNNYHLEKNYCFVGFAESDRNAEFICNRINESIAAINAADLGYQIDDFFSVDNTITHGVVGSGQPGGKLIHNKLNYLHRYFEDLQGVSGAMSNYYSMATHDIRWHIRQLNLLCHEYETLVLSMRKKIQAPEWQRPSQLMCWLNAPRFKLAEEDFDLFGIDSLCRPLGGVFVGVNKAVGKHHWEVFKDENGDVAELVTTTLKSQTEAAGDFDIEWANNPGEYPWMQSELSAFKQWLVANNFDPEDKSLTIGHPQVGQVDLIRSFGSTDYKEIWKVVGSHSNVCSISTASATAVFDYNWSDSDYMQRQIALLR